MQYDNTNSGALFTNANKKTEKHPDFTGKINVDGKDYQLAGWKKQGKSGGFLSLKVSTNQDREASSYKKESFDI